jgi:predicted nucleic acid-binding protein
MIIDASVGVKWLIVEEHTERANALIGENLVVPSLFFVEVANAIWKKARRGELLIDPILPQFPKLRLITTILDESSFAERALALGRELDHAVYDCVYLAMAEQRQEQLVTADTKLLRRVAGTGYDELVRPL